MSKRVILSEEQCNEIRLKYKNGTRVFHLSREYHTSNQAINKAIGKSNKIKKVIATTGRINSGHFAEDALKKKSENFLNIKNFLQHRFKVGDNIKFILTRDFDYVQKKTHSVWNPYHAIITQITDNLLFYKHNKESFKRGSISVNDIMDGTIKELQAVKPLDMDRRLFL